MNFIKDLFYGKLQPYSRTFTKNSAYDKAISTIVQNEKNLTKELPAPLKSQFSALIDAQNEIISITAYESFLDGFLLGAGLVHDTFMTKHDHMLNPL